VLAAVENEYLEHGIFETGRRLLKHLALKAMLRAYRFACHRLSCAEVDLAVRMQSHWSLRSGETSHGYTGACAGAP
jgi:hypothetical protein